MPDLWEKIANIQASKGPAHCCTFSSGLGNHLLTGGQDRAVKLYNPRTGNLIQAYNGHGYEVLGVASSHDNTRLASCGGDRSVFYWDVATAQPIKRFSGHTARVNAVAFNAESTIMASGSFDASVRLWDLKSQQWMPIQVLEDAKDSITSILITEYEMYTACVDGHVRCYDLRQGQLRADFFECKRLVLLSALITPQLYSSQICIFPRAAPVTSLSITKDRNVLLVSTLNSTIRLMDLTDGKMLVKYKGHQNTSYRIHHTFDSRDEHVIAGDEKGILYTWKMEQGENPTTQPLQDAKEVTKTCLWTAIHPSKTEGMIATASGDGVVRVWRRRQA